MEFFGEITGTEISLIIHLRREANSYEFIQRLWRVRVHYTRVSMCVRVCVAIENERKMWYWSQILISKRIISWLESPTPLTHKTSDCHKKLILSFCLSQVRFANTTSTFSLAGSAGTLRAEATNSRRFADTPQPSCRIIEYYRSLDYRSNVTEEEDQ